jgi:hypothetical protein
MHTNALASTSATLMCHALVGCGLPTTVSRRAPSFDQNEWIGGQRFGVAPIWHCARVSPVHSTSCGGLCVTATMDRERWRLGLQAFSGALWVDASRSKGGYNTIVVRAARRFTLPTEPLPIFFSANSRLNLLTSWWRTDHTSGSRKHNARLRRGRIEGCRVGQFG